MVLSYVVMQMSGKNLAKFRQWLIDRGRSEDTAALYIGNLGSCSRDPKGLTNRLTAGDLAPNTLRTNLASLRAWATFSDDKEFLTRLSDIRLPPARRIRSKEPLSMEKWREMAQLLGRTDVQRPVSKRARISTRDREDAAMRHVLLIMARRGLRCSDVLRLRRQEVVRALATGKLSYEGKGRKRIELSTGPIHEQLEALAQYRGWERVRELVSTGRGCAARKRVWRAAKRTGLEVGIAEMSPHRCRHTFATNFLAKLRGDPNAIVKLQKYMGWESLATAARYVDSISMDELDQIGGDLVGALTAP